MADRGQFEEETRQQLACQVCEAMLPDAVDGLLSEAEQRAFDRHVAGCVVCSRELEEAQRGAAWLGMLKQQTPEPSSALLERILAQTSGVQTVGTQATQAQAADVRVASVAPARSELLPAWRSAALPARTQPRQVSAWQAVSEMLRGAASLEWMRPMLQPRMAMTAAMAFFSIALTLNLTGVRLSDLNTASLRPSSLRRVVADRSTAAVRSFQNMRVVYQAEAQVNDLRSNWQQQPPEDRPAPARPAPRQDAEPKQNNDTPQGSSELNMTPMNLRGAGMTKKGA